MTLMSVVSVGGPAVPGRYVHWGVINISLTNLLIVVIMLVVFALAILVPMGGDAASTCIWTRRLETHPTRPGVWWMQAMAADHEGPVASADALEQLDGAP